MIIYNSLGMLYSSSAEETLVGVVNHLSKPDVLTNSAITLL